MLWPLPSPALLCNPPALFFSQTPSLPPSLVAPAFQRQTSSAAPLSIFPFSLSLASLPSSCNCPPSSCHLCLTTAPFPYPLLSVTTILVFSYSSPRVHLTSHSPSLLLRWLPVFGFVLALVLCPHIPPFALFSIIIPSSPHLISHPSQFLSYPTLFLFCTTSLQSALYHPFLPYPLPFPSLLSPTLIPLLHSLIDPSFGVFVSLSPLTL